MRALRFVLTAVIAIATLEALAFWCYGRWDCNVMKRSVEARTTRIYATGEPYSNREVDIAQLNLTQIAGCMDRYSWDVDLHMELAANLSVVRRYDDVVRTYQDALRIDRRPEIYLNLGRAQLKANRPAEAIESFLAALRFNSSMVSGEDMLQVTDEVMRRWNAERPVQ